MDKNLTKEEKAILNRLSRHYHTLSLKNLKKQAEKIGLNPQKVELTVKKAIKSGRGIKGYISLEEDTLVYLL